MDRRKFLGLFSAGVAGIALEQAIPLGRVWSFPKKIVIGSNMNFRFPPRFEIGDVVTLRSSLRFPGYLGPFLVTDVYESARGLEVDLKAPRHCIAGLAIPANALDPFPIVAFPPGNSHTPS